MHTMTVSCSDPRVIPEQYFGLNRGGLSYLFFVRSRGDNALTANLVRGLPEAAVIRNAGGRASDALRSIATLDAIAGLSTIIVIHHTGKYGIAANDCLVLYNKARQLTRQQIVVLP